MVRVEKSRRAERDLKEIWIYTFENWGEAQADAYLYAIDAAIDRLRDQPSSGTDHGHIRKGYRRLTVARHRVFYVLKGQTIEIVRILHERMDVDDRLG